MTEQNTNTQEIWKPVPEWEDLYEVSSFGIVRNRKTKRTLTPCINEKGYVKVSFNRSYKHKSVRVHRLVAAAFIGPCPPKLQVNHIDGNKQNNRLENLEYLTNQQNKQHSAVLGTIMRGRTHYLAKLDEDKVREIRELSASGWGARRLAKRYDVSRRNVQEIIKGNAWKHVT